MRPSAVELHEAAEDEAVFAGAQAADVGGELLREHGDGAVGEVDAGAAQAGFEIEIGAGANVFGDVGDVDLQLVAAVGALGDEDSVVEVAGGFAVDGDDGQAAKIAAAGDFVVVEVRDAAGFCEDVVREDAREVVLADHHLDVDAEIVGIAEDFDDATDGRLEGRGPAGDLDIDDQALQIVVVEVRCGLGAEGAMGGCVARLGGELIAAGDDDVLRHALVKGDDDVAGVAAGAGIVERPDDGGVAALDDAGDAAGTAAIGFGRVEFDEHLIALHGAVDFGGRNKDVFGHAGRLLDSGADEAEAVAVQVETAGEEVVAAAGRARDGPVIAVEVGELAAHGEALQLIEEQTALAAAAQAELADKLFVAGFAAGRAGDARDQVAIGHGLRVGHGGMRRRLSRVMACRNQT